MRISILLLLAVTACGSTIPGAPADRVNARSTVAPRETIDLTRDTEVIETSLDASPARVWEVLHEVHEALGIPFANGRMEDGSAVFQLQNQIRSVARKPASKYLDCGMGPAGPRADSYRLLIKLMHRFDSPAPGRTSLRTILEASARNPAISSDPVPCSSKGLLEAEIGGMVALRIKPAN